MHGTRNCLAALLVLLATGTGIAQTPPHWSAGAPMPSARAEIAVAELGGKIYVVGAFTGERELEIYDTSANRWSRGAPLPHSVHHPAAAAVNGKIYAIGGYVSGWTPTACGSGGTLRRISTAMRCGWSCRKPRAIRRSGR